MSDETRDLSTGTGSSAGSPVDGAEGSAEQRRLQEKVAELPAEIQPSSDLWPEISARLTPRESAEKQPAPGMKDEAEPRPRASRPIATWGMRMAAAFAYMAIGSTLTLWWTGTADTDGVAGSKAPMVGEVMPASSTGAPGGSTAGHSIDLMEANYLQAKEALWSRALENRDSLPPGTLKVVAKNLDILEIAIRDLRRALELDPGNPKLERRLMDNHRRSLELLRKVVREV